MDALALLCTLHADGPKTARRLRHAGVDDLSMLREIPRATLAEALQGDLAKAERFLREAEFLRRRVGKAPLEEEPSTHLHRVPEDEPEPRPALPSRKPDASLPTEEPVPQREHVLQRYVINPLIRPAKKSLRVRRLPEPTDDHRLRPGVIEGLDREACERLIAGGVRTVEDLAQSSGLDLALELGWAYDRVFHLKKEASHFVRTRRTAHHADAAR